MRRFQEDILTYEQQIGKRDIQSRRLFNTYVTAGGKLPERRANETAEAYLKRVQAFHRAANERFQTSSSSSSSRSSVGTCPICQGDMYNEQDLLPLHNYLRCTKCFGAKFIERGNTMEECDCRTNIEGRKHYCHRTCIEGQGKYLYSLRNKSPQFRRCPLCRETIHFDENTWTLLPPSIAIGFNERNYPMLHALIDADPTLINVPDEHGNTPLHRLLLEGIEQGEEGKTHEENKLIIRGRINFLQFLLRQDCDLELQNNRGDTPLHILFSFMSPRLINRFGLPSNDPTFVDEWETIRNNQGQNIFDIDTTDYFRRAFRKRKRKSPSDNDGSGSSSSSSSPVFDLTVFQDDATVYGPTEEQIIERKVHKQFRKQLRKRKNHLRNNNNKDDWKTVLDSDDEYQKILQDRKRVLQQTLEKHRQDKAYKEAQRMDALKQNNKKPSKKQKVGNDNTEDNRREEEDARRHAIWDRIATLRREIRDRARNKTINHKDANKYMKQLDTVRSITNLGEAERQLKKITEEVYGALKS